MIARQFVKQSTIRTGGAKYCDDMENSPKHVPVTCRKFAAKHPQTDFVALMQANVGSHRVTRQEEPIKYSPPTFPARSER